MTLKISYTGICPIDSLRNFYGKFCFNSATQNAVSFSFSVGSKIFPAILFCSLLPLIIVCHSFGQTLPVLKSHKYNISIRDGDDFRKGRWKIDPIVNPDTYQALMALNQNYKLVTFITDVDSLQLRVEKGKTYPFVIIVNDKDSAFTQVQGGQSPVTFTKEYIKSHQGKTFVEIPAVYELVNVVIALTNTGKNKEGLVIKDTPYYRAVRNWFGRYGQEPIVKKIDSVLSKSNMEYFSIKTNAYSFDFTAKGRIVPSAVYDRFTNTNSLRPYLNDLQQFADKSKFETFFRQHQSLYKRLIRVYRDSIGIGQMQNWLEKNFPGITYNSYKIVFSPLVGNNQSANWFEYNGFKEVQAHINFPYRTQEEKKEFSGQALHVKDGNIVFTELNHNFIGPEGQKQEYQNKINEAFANLTTWTRKGSPAASGYNNARACFDEYMNWALVSLRYIDYAPPLEQAKLIAKMEKHQVEVRGFVKFTEFDQFLIRLYKNRSKGQVIADLYPQIVTWFVTNK